MLLYCTDDNINITHATHVRSRRRGVSDTIPPPKSMLEAFGQGGRSDRLDKAMSTMQGADQLREMESMTAKDQKRAEMEQRGLSSEQIAAYLGEDPPPPLFLWLFNGSICRRFL